MNSETVDRFLSGPEILRRYGVSAMTVHRWRHDPDVAFPDPEMVIGGRNYFREAAVVDWERRRAKASGSRRITSSAGS
ncbi:MAG: DNA-binding protein [Mesorhizobium sp.]|nr:DNA-binding protein [Mesorhizobium sp.]